MNQNSAAIAPILTNFPGLEKISEPDTYLPPVKVNGVAKIGARVLDNGILVQVNNKSIKLRYPQGIWSRFPKTHKKILAQNIAFGLTFHLPYIFKSLKRMMYNIPVPLSEAYFFKGLSLALCSYLNKYTQYQKNVL